jgi:2-C-methyl-D-erythritol 2,4-cyclodiphosphate synthase
MNIRVGQGIDFHRLKDGLDLWLGGIKIHSEKGCVAHSDGDVLIHAICDAILGAAGLRDIGIQFPDTSAEFKNIDSKKLLTRSFEFIRQKGFYIANIDCTLCLEKPKISAFIPEMQSIISSILETEPENITIKATTAEKLGFIGREEGVAAFAVALLTKDLIN